MDKTTEHQIQWFPLEYFKSSRVYLNPAYFIQTTFYYHCLSGLFKALLDIIDKGEETKSWEAHSYDPLLVWFVPLPHTSHRLDQPEVDCGYWVLNQCWKCIQLTPFLMKTLEVNISTVCQAKKVKAVVLFSKDLMLIYQNIYIKKLFLSNFFYP